MEKLESPFFFFALSLAHFSLLSLAHFSLLSLHPRLFPSSLRSAPPQQPSKQASMHPFLLEQPAFPPAATPAATEQENEMRVSEKDGAEKAAAAVAVVAANAAAEKANASSLDIAALALTPRSEAAAAARVAAALAQARLASARLAPAANANAAPPPLPPPPRKVKLRIEARLRASHPAAACPQLRRDLELQLSSLLRDRSWVYRDQPAVNLSGASADLLSAVEACKVVDTELEAACLPGTVLLFWQVELCVVCYAVSSEPPAVPPSLEDDGEQGGNGGGGAPPYKESVLPHASFEGSLDALALPPGAKTRVLRRLGSALALGGAGVDPRLVPSGRLALLLGPPGTGKTTLCRAVAQRLAIRLCCSADGGPGSGPSRFPGGALLLEVSAPALFSKWFSESGRAVARLFERVASLANDEQALVFVLIDEVESLAGSRTSGSSSSSSCSSGGDPGDAMRAVNALLTGAALFGIIRSFLPFFRSLSFFTGSFLSLDRGREVFDETLQKKKTGKTEKSRNRP